MAQKGPGKAYLKWMSLREFMTQLPSDAVAEKWFIEQRWPDGVCCPVCGSHNVRTGCKHKAMPFRCREKACGKKFSVKTGSVMEGAKLGCQPWLTAKFLVSTSLKGVASMKLHRDLGVPRKPAWFMAMRIRTALTESGTLFAGPDNQPRRADLRQEHRVDATLDEVVKACLKPVRIDCVKAKEPRHKM